MALETGTFISDLVATNPTGSDALAFADDHLRLIKSTVKATFPNISGAVTKTHTQLNNTLDKTGDTMTGALTLSGDASSALHAVPKQQLDAVIAATKAALYPIGSIYTNATNNTNPATLLGFGTWVAFGAGRVPVGFDATDPLFDTAEETGGSKDAAVVAHTHTGTTASSGSHQHYILDNARSGSEAQYTPTVYADKTLAGMGGGGGYELYTLSGTTNAATGGLTSSAGAHTHSFTTGSTGSSGTNANLQPYITVYMWKRTA
jgi:hypothetical protein